MDHVQYGCMLLQNNNCDNNTFLNDQVVMEGDYFPLLDDEKAAS